MSDFDSGFNLLDPKIPLVFADGTKIYDELGKKYVKHETGFFILGPSGVGKTHFIKNQKEAHWLDGDELWMSANAHPKGEWWLEDISVIDEIDKRCDVVTQEAKKLGFWIMGASNYWLKPDAVVIPDWDEHVSFIKKRESTNYDGGVTSNNLERLETSRKWMARWESEGVPIFKSVDLAVEHLLGK